MNAKILRIDSVELRLVKTNPEQLYVVAKGSASTPGWENPELLLITKNPLNGLYEFDFYATPPTGMVPQVITPISASYHFEKKPSDLLEVKVNASSNFVRQRLIVEDKVEFPDGSTKPELETILGVEVLKDQLRVRVPSTGCTSKESFTIDVDKGITGKAPFTITIYRIMPDYCEVYMPEGIILEWRMADLGMKSTDTFTVSNTIGKP
jgi:hypothetical protein